MKSVVNQGDMRIFCCRLQQAFIDNAMITRDIAAFLF